ncbi:MAG: alginate export family protein, partial [Candidatus Marinimicrobia bacterium]|nr:alginate export family protein [Candidatus Neomarinimicrobiota bacterium]
MRIIYLLIIYIFPFFLFGSELEWQAEFRYRLMQDRSTSNSENTISEFSTYSLLRSRIFFKLVNGPVSINMQLQDSRILGDLINSPGVAGEDQTKATFHQAYLNTHNILRRNWSIQIGRFQFPLGQQRLFSKNNWNNIGRSFEGFLTYRKSQKTNLRLFYLINNESYDRLDNDLYDQTINGFYFDFSLKQLLIHKRMSPFLGSNIEVYGFRTGLAEDRDGLLVQNYYRTTYGSRIYTSFLFFTFEAEAALQSGRINGGHVDGFLSAVNFGAKLDFL